MALASLEASGVPAGGLSSTVSTAGETMASEDCDISDTLDWPSVSSDFNSGDSVRAGGGAGALRFLPDDSEAFELLDTWRQTKSFSL